MSDLTDRIVEDAAKPQVVTNDGVTVQRRTLQDQIAADRYARDSAATADMAATLRGMMFKIVPPGGH